MSQIDSTLMGSLAASLMSPQASASGGVANPYMNVLRRRNAQQQSAQPRGRGQGTPMAQHVEAHNPGGFGGATKAVYGSQAGAYLTNNGSGGGPGNLGPSAVNLAQEESGPAQPLQSHGQDLIQQLVHAHGLGAQHAQVGQAILQSGGNLRDVLSYMQGAQNQGMRQQGEDIRNTAENEKFASQMREQNQFGPGGLKAHEADVKEQENTSRLQDTDSRAAETNAVRLKGMIDREKDPTAQAPLQAELEKVQAAGKPGSSVYAQEQALNQQGQGELLQRQNQIQNQGSIPEDVARQFYQQAGGDPAKARAMYQASLGAK